MILLCTVLLWADIFLHEYILLKRRDNTIYVCIASFFYQCRYRLLTRRGNITCASTFTSWADSSLQRMISIPTSVSVQCSLEWRTLEIRFFSRVFCALVFVSVCPELKFWILRFQVDTLHRWSILLWTTVHLRTAVDNEFESCPFSFWHVLKAFCHSLIPLRTPMFVLIIWYHCALSGVFLFSEHES